VFPADPSAIVSSSSTIPHNQTCRANDSNDMQYLILLPPLPGGNLPDVNGIKSVATKLAIFGDGKTTQLGVGGGIPIWVSDEAKIVREIKLRFDIAKQTNTAAYFVVDDHIGWDARPDLWNWHNPSTRGYNPDNRKNVEWYDWEENPNKRRYITPDGAPSQTPHMCYNSPADPERDISDNVSSCRSHAKEGNRQAQARQ
jgi:hypothetical protein